MRRLLLAFLFVITLTFGPAITTAQACPMCAEANKTEENRPKAYMYSILFMISMPALIFTGFGIGFYRLHRKQAADPQSDSFEEENLPL